VIPLVWTATPMIAGNFPILLSKALLLLDSTHFPPAKGFTLFRQLAF